jgi:hypothetical protein
MNTTDKTELGLPLIKQLCCHIVVTNYDPGTFYKCLSKLYSNKWQIIFVECGSLANMVHMNTLQLNTR